MFFAFLLLSFILKENSVYSEEENLNFSNNSYIHSHHPTSNSTFISYNDRYYSKLYLKSSLSTQKEYSVQRCSVKRDISLLHNELLLQLTVSAYGELASQFTSHAHLILFDKDFEAENVSDETPFFVKFGPKWSAEGIQLEVILSLFDRRYNEISQRLYSLPLNISINDSSSHIFQLRLTPQTISVSVDGKRERKEVLQLNNESQWIVLSRERKEEEEIIKNKKSEENVNNTINENDNITNNNNNNNNISSLSISLEGKEIKGVAIEVVNGEEDVCVADEWRVGGGLLDAFKGDLLFKKRRLAEKRKEREQRGREIIEERKEIVEKIKIIRESQKTIQKELGILKNDIKNKTKEIREQEKRDLKEKLEIAKKKMSEKNEEFSEKVNETFENLRETLKLLKEEQAEYKRELKERTRRVKELNHRWWFSFYDQHIKDDYTTYEIIALLIILITVCIILFGSIFFFIHEKCLNRRRYPLIHSSHVNHSPSPHPSSSRHGEERMRMRENGGNITMQPYHSPSPIRSANRNTVANIPFSPSSSSSSSAFASSPVRSPVRRSSNNNNNNNIPVQPNTLTDQPIVSSSLLLSSFSSSNQPSEGEENKEEKGRRGGGRHTETVSHGVTEQRITSNIDHSINEENMQRMHSDDVNIRPTRGRSAGSGRGRTHKS